VKVLRGDVHPPEDNATSRDGQHGLGLELIVVASPHFGQFLPHELGISRLELGGTGGLHETLGEVHPVRRSLVHEQRVDYGVRRISSKYGFLLLLCEMDAQFSIVQQRRQPAGSGLRLVCGREARQGTRTKTFQGSPMLPRRPGSFLEGKTTRAYGGDGERWASEGKGG